MSYFENGKILNLILFILNLFLFFLLFFKIKILNKKKLNIFKK